MLSPLLLPSLAVLDTTDLIIIGITAIAMLIVGSVGTIFMARMFGSKTVGDAKKDAEDIVNRAKGDAESITKKIELDFRGELVKRREDFEKETESARTELKDSERRIAKREDNLDRKLDVLTTKERFLEEFETKVKNRETVLGKKEDEIDELIAQRREILEKSTQEQKHALLRISNLNPEEARKEALRLIEHDVQHEADLLIKHKMGKADEEAKEYALKVTLQAIQRYASEHTAATTVNAVAIPSDDMKGRVIGREGRNIRAFEKATGVDVIVDDTPGVIVVSCFDPVRRAIAAEALQKLLEDGRIHPARIEEIVEQIEKEMAQRLIKFGKDAAVEVNLPNLHPRISEMMGRLNYRTSYGQNILRHSVEVAFLCQVIADELGLDGELARRCGYLHDIGKAMDHEVEGGHPAIGMEFAKKFGEREEVLNAIGGHHNDIPSTSPYTPIVMAADAISGARPGARRETLEKYIKRLEQLEGIATGMPGVKQAFAIQAGREVRVIVDPEQVDDPTCHALARDIAKKVSEEMTFPGEIRITVLREMRTVEYAR